MPKVKTVVSAFPFSTNLRQSARLSCRRPIAALGLLFVVLSLAATSTFATSYSWTNTTGAVFTNAGVWSPAGPPASSDDAFITNYIGATSITITNRGTGGTTAGRGIVTNSNLTIFNDAGAGVYTLQLSNTIMRVTGTTKIGTNAVVTLGQGATGSASVFSNNNLFLTATAAIVFNSASASGNLTNTLIVAGAFSNSVSTVITNIGTGGGILLFTASSPVTNKGLINFSSITAGTAGNTGLVLQVGTAGALNTFRNEGNVIIGNAGAASANGTQVYAFSNQLVNAGTLVVTNNGATRSTNTVFVTGSGTGAAITNEATGTIKFAVGGGTDRANLLTNTSDIVNMGTIIGQAVAGGLNKIYLTSGSVFSNALGGQVIVTGAGSNLVIGADTIVNLGTNVINAGTLFYRTSADAANTLANQGTILFAGGNLDIDRLTNTTTGVIKVTNGVNTIVGTFFENDGTIDISAVAGTTTLSNVAFGATWTNSGRVLLDGGGGTATLSGGQVHNLGTNQTTGGRVVILNAAGTVLTNAVGGTYIVGGGDTAGLRFGTAGAGTAASNTFYNGGTFTYNAGTIAVGSFINTNSFVVSHNGVGTAIGTITATGTAPVFSNAANARIIVSSGTVVYDGGAIDNLGVITAYGNGVFGMIGGAGVNFTNAAGGLIINTNVATTLGIRSSIGNFRNAGDIVVSNGATINFMQSSGADQNLTNLAGGRLFVGNATSDGVFNSGTLANSGTIEGSGTLNMSIPGTNVSARPLINLDTGTLRVLDNRVLTVTNVGGTAFRQVVIVDVQTNLFNMYNSGTVIVGSGTSALRVYSGTNSAGNSFAVSMYNSGTIQMNGGTLAFLTPTASTVSNIGGWVKGSGTITNSTIYNTGTIFANSTSPLILSGPSVENLASGVVTANVGRLVVNGAFNNANGATVTFINSVGTFNGTVVNSGAWVTDPSTNVFNSSYTVTPSGFIAASAGDVYIYKSNFVNESTQNTTYDTFNTTAGGSGAAGTKFIFDGTNTVNSSGYTQTFVTAGLKLTGGFVGATATATSTQNVSSFAAVTGFVDNFALDRLEIGSLSTNSIMELSSLYALNSINDTNALFVNDLEIFGSSQLILSNAVLYFVNSNNWSLANISLINNGEIHQLTLQSEVSAVPEPSVILLWLSGIVTVYAARRRARAKKA